MRYRGRAAVLTVALVVQGAFVLPAGAVEEEPRVSVLAEGLDGPRGVAVDDDGAVYVAETGRGGDAEDGHCWTEAWEDPETGESEEYEVCVGLTSRITRVTPDGTVDRGFVTGIVSIGSEGEGEGGASDVAVAPDGEIYVTVGLGANVSVRDEVAEAFPAAAMFGTVQRVTEDGSLELVADIAQFENDENPDGVTEDPEAGPDSNPDGLHVTEDTIYVADAGGNTLLAVDRETGDIDVAAVVHPRQQQMPPEFGGGEIPMQAVPTSVSEDPDGGIVFGELTGFPFPPGEANVYRVSEEPHEPEIVASGFTAGMSVGYLRDELYVLEFAHNGLLEAFGGGDMAGALVRVREDDTRASLLRHVLTLPAGMAVGANDTIFLSDGAVFTGSGRLLAFDASPTDAAIDHGCPPGAVVADGLSDIAGTTHEDAIACVQWHHLVRGFDDGTFRPGHAIDRGQFASMVHRLAVRTGAELPAGDPDRFDDLDPEFPHARAINALAEAEVIRGFADGTFRPRAQISRDQAATMLVEAYQVVTGQPLPDGPDAFDDDDDSVHEEAINAAAAAGWIRGVAPGEFGPRRDITRGQVASVVARKVSTLVRTGELEFPGPPEPVEE